MDVGESMRKCRKRKSVSIAKLSRMSGIHQNTIRNSETNKHMSNIYTIMKLADALGVSIDEYVGHEPLKENLWQE